jgi:hypothetical protein
MIDCTIDGRSESNGSCVLQLPIFLLLFPLPDPIIIPFPLPDDPIIIIPFPLEDPIIIIIIPPFPFFDDRFCGQEVLLGAGDG